MKTGLRSAGFSPHSGLNVMAVLEIEPLGPALGARVAGMDLREDYDEATAAAMRAAFVEHAMLCFPDQKISAADQVRFAAVFGPVDAGFRPPSSILETTNSKRGVMLVSNIRKNGRQIGSLPDGEMMFHSDGAHREMPYRATTLFAIKIPSRGGETLFANLTKAYEALPRQRKEWLQGKRARHIYNYDSVTRDLIDKTRTDLSAAVHPLVKVHPDSGRKALYLSRLMTESVLDTDPAESAQILEELFDHAERPEFVHAHRWAPGDLVIWDNRRLNHARTDFPAGEDRLLRRYTISEQGQI